MHGVRKAIFDLDTYAPGKPIDELLREIPGLAGRSITKLASNENPLGPSPKAVAAMEKLLKKVHLYPESTAPLLRAKLAEHCGVSPDYVILGSGADEILRLIVETLVEPGDPCVISRLAFSRFRQHLKLMGGRVIETAARGFGHDLEAMALAVEEVQAKVVFIANPNNPTGTFNTASEMERFLGFLAKVAQPPWVVLDEAYGDFALDAYPGSYPQSLPGYLGIYPRLIVVRTFSKIAGLAGLRVGWAVAEPDFLNLVERARLIFNVNILAQAAALAALDDKEFIVKTLKIVRQGRFYLESELAKLGFEAITPGAANFICARVPLGTAQALCEGLLREGVIIRAVAEPELHAHVRITIGTAAQNRALLAALKKVLA